jgi:hypothetical protein
MAIDQDLESVTRRPVTNGVRNQFAHRQEGVIDPGMLTQNRSNERAGLAGRVRHRRKV